MVWQRWDSLQDVPCGTRSHPASDRLSWVCYVDRGYSTLVRRVVS